LYAGTRVFVGAHGALAHHPRADGRWYALCKYLQSAAAGQGVPMAARELSAAHPFEEEVPPPRTTLAEEMNVYLLGSEPTEQWPGGPPLPGRGRPLRLAPRVTNLLHFPRRGSQGRFMGAPPQGHDMTRVLVVDDDADTRRMLREALLDAGYAVEGAAHGLAALHSVRRWRPDVILLDLIMPRMHGWAFAEAYRKLPDSSAPIIAMTAAGPEAVRTAATIKPVAVLLKPVDLQELLDLIARHALNRAA
jgi:CheY-like chemotaxis protein